MTAAAQYKSYPNSTISASSALNTSLATPPQSPTILSAAFAPPFTLARTAVSRGTTLKPTVMSLRGKNVVITGATRGIGRGLALGFGEKGANVYITGRTAGSGPDSLGGVAELVRQAGGNCDYFIVDHSKDEAIASFFSELQKKLRADNSTLDVFINNAYAAVGFIEKSIEVPFWKKDVDNPDVPNSEADPGKVWDIVNGVGLRNNYICSTRAIGIMEKQRSGLVVNITSWGGLFSIFDPAYAIGKEAIDRMVGEIARGAPDGVKSIGFCPGFVTTEDLLRAAEMAEAKRQERGDVPQNVNLPLWNAETPLFVGRALAALVSDDRSRLLESMNGKVVIGAEAAEILNVNDENNFRPLSFRSVRFNLMQWIPFLQDSPLRKLIPRTLYAPWWLVRAYGGTTQYW